MSTLERAVAIAAEAHAGQIDKAGDAYILHPLRVMMSVDGESERIAAVLHDVVEDTSWSLDRLRSEGFSEQVVRAVDGLTRRAGEDYFDFCRRAGADPVARVVKLADIEDNLDLSRISNPTNADHERIERYRKARAILLKQGNEDAREGPFAALKDVQRAWALTQGYQVDSKGYLGSVDQNLFQPLSEVARSGLKGGGGGEFFEGIGQPAKLRALHSSAALAVNVFDYWTQGEHRQPLEAALDLTSGIEEIQFERKFSTGLGAPANLDVVLILEDGTSLAVESKFTEWMTPKPTSRRSFSSSYFPEGRSLWADVGLVQCQNVAAAIKDESRQFMHLDVPQLLKHALGLARALRDRFQLWYIYFDWDGEAADRHREEITDFSDAVGPEVRFRALSYQKLFEALAEASGEDHRGYLEYLGSRYFRNG